MDTRHSRHASWTAHAATATVALSLFAGPASLQAAQPDNPGQTAKAEKAASVKPAKPRKEPEPDIDDPAPPPADVGPALPDIVVDKNTFKRDKHLHGRSKSRGKVEPEKFESRPQAEIHVLLSETDGKKDKVEK